MWGGGRGEGKGEAMGLMKKGPETTFQSNGNILCIDYHGGYTGVYICQNLSNCMLKVVGLY